MLNHHEPAPATSSAPFANGHAVFHGDAARLRIAPPSAPPEAPRVPDAPGLDIPVRDWDVLFTAVKLRLAYLGSRPPGDPPEPTVQCGVLECVEALEQLHRTMKYEVDLATQLEAELVEARDLLGAVHGTPPGSRTEERIAQYRFRHDGLTNLPNRGWFGERLDRSLAEADDELPAVALLYLDLDSFQPVNDRHGHQVGDEVIRIVASRLARTLRAADLVGRVGDDEFACAIHDLDDTEALGRLAFKLFEAVGAPVKIGELEINVSASIGVATCPADGDCAEDLLSAAGSAMHRAKRERMRYAFFDRGLDA